MANINRKWRRVMAQGCSHGELANRKILAQVLKFRDQFKPEIRFELGDVVDTAAYRSGAHGTKDEARNIEPDLLAGARWLQQYEPTHVAWGNHCWRVRELLDHPNAIIAHSASIVWNELQTQVNFLKAKTVPYDYEHGWFEMGGTAWGHGYWFSENAVRDHAEYLGMPCVMAHLHVAQEVRGRTRRPTQSFCVGTLAEIDNMHYARRRRATSRWSHGFVFGEICDNEAQLWLASCQKGGTFRLPFKF